MMEFRAMYPSSTPETSEGVADAYYHAITLLVDVVLGGVPAGNKVRLRLETIQDMWPGFWQWVCAEGDMDKAAACLDKK